MTHFVYVYANQGTMWDQVIVHEKGIARVVRKGPNELYFSIMSLHKFFQGPKKIFVVGDRPGVRGVVHIPHKNIVNVPHPKAADSIAKLKIIVAHPDINEDFVYMHDDMVLLKPCREADFRVIRANDLCVSAGTYFSSKDRQSPKWKQFFMRSMTILKKQGYPTWNYETHLPRWFNKAKVVEIIAKYGMDNPTNKAQVLFATMYYNTYFSEPQQVLTQKPNIKAGIYEPHIAKWLEKNVPGKLFLNYDNPGLNDHLKRFVKQLLK